MSTSRLATLMIAANLQTMSRSRLFSPDPVPANSSLTLGSEAARYVGRVLRLKAGDSLTVFDGSGAEFPATVERVTRQALTLAVGERVSRNRESPLRIHLVQGISRGERMDVVVQKATELGVIRLSPVLTDYSVVRLAPDRAAKRHAHWQKIAQSACEQCGRNIVPTIDAPRSLDDWFAAHDSLADSALILRADAATPIASIDPPAAGLTMLVGPEGGFSESEQARAAAVGFHAVNLGPRILRTETAALAALAIAQANWGDCRHR